MNNDNLKKIGTLIDSKFEGFRGAVTGEITASEERLKKHIKGEITASEERLKKHTAESVKQLSTDVGNFIAENLFPMIEEKADKIDIDRLEHKLDRVLDTSLDHESRIKAIEQVFVVAHELKLKKSK